jgi:ABC-type nitrate/sulfonate/bicarbonate transport system ATPase subunit
VIEDAIDALLTRSKHEPALASIKTNIARVVSLLESAKMGGGDEGIEGIDDDGNKRSSESSNSTRVEHAPCTIAETAYTDDGSESSNNSDAKELQIVGLYYSRGHMSGRQSAAHIDDLRLRTGHIYAVTGGNGCGKSTLFEIIGTCSALSMAGGRAQAANAAFSPAPQLHPSIQLLSLRQLSLPSADVVEVTQDFYCPLFTKPMEWLVQNDDACSSDEAVLAADEAGRCEGVDYTQRFVELAIALEIFSDDDFHAGVGAGDTNTNIDTNTDVPNSGIANASATNNSSSKTATANLRALLEREHDDWYSSLSGGQRAKVELIRKVFLRPECPGVLLIDEAFAALDPKSKGVVQTMLRQRCSKSVLLVIYHQDAEQECVPAGGFFDDNLRFEGGHARLVGTCK